MPSGERRSSSEPSVIIMGNISTKKETAQRAFAEPFWVYDFIVSFKYRNWYTHIEYIANEY